MQVAVRPIGRGIFGGGMACPIVGSVEFVALLCDNV